MIIVNYIWKTQREQLIKSSIAIEIDINHYPLDSSEGFDSTYV